MNKKISTKTNHGLVGLLAQIHDEEIKEGYIYDES